MDENHLSELARKMMELDRVIRRLDPASRSVVIEMLAYHNSEDAARPALAEPDRDSRKPGTRREAPAPATHAVPIQQQPTPGDNVLLCAAMLFSENRNAKLTNPLLQSRGHEIGVRLPKDPSRTLRLMRDGGRVLFRFDCDGWKVTPAGATYLRNHFGARLGAPQKTSGGRAA